MTSTSQQQQNSQDHNGIPELLPQQIQQMMLLAVSLASHIQSDPTIA